MKKLTFSIVADAIFLFLGGGLLLFILLRFWLSAPLALAISLLAAFAASTLSARRKSRKYAGSTVKKSEEKACAALIEALPLLAGSALDGVRRALRAYANAPAEGEEKSETVRCRFAFRYAPFSRDDAAELLRAARPAGAVFSAEFDAEAKSMLESRGIRAVGGAEIYRALSEANALPALPDRPAKPKWHELFRATFRKSRAGQFLVLGITLLAFSMIVPFPVYYLVSGGLFVLYALTARLFGKAD